MDCPICKGSGQIHPPRHIADKDAMIKALVDAGYSYRQVCALVGQSSPNGIMLAVRRAEKAAMEGGGNG